MSSRPTKIRADRLLVDRGLAESREQAQALIMEGVVYTPSGRVLKAGSTLAGNVDLEVKGRLPFVSRGGVKLAHALDEFHLDVTGLTGLDVGASTGGFTDCLLQRGAQRVYAVDVGHGQMDYRLRQDSRVVVQEKVNARNPFEISEPVDLVTMDVSFISLTLVIPEAARHLNPGRYILALVKPQFEAEKEQVGRGGVIKDPKVHAAVLGKMVNWAVGQEVRLRNMCRSPIQGDAGNQEFFILLQKPEDE
ncbi:MAG TPA: TlyA family rRNA (cytidine-2'-O)-methyltransferase [Dehalococcoidia bacterium]|nr:TlyA family rRNA (cytidine-2'-O)-methyltransferase [Chloroflexota bacterium]HAA94238.1 TlyA family rRNA (cytidine-2'-O)-methyltransferase [Dehalococcoidia bacterium]HCL24888.1 TlyA family rRNA (cytidine-2'-O)-methyltransferase [Dehalococcoidia bacterium]